LSLKKDINNHKLELLKNVLNATFLLFGGAGSIAQAITKEIFKRKAHKLHSINFQRNSIRFVNFFMNGASRIAKHSLLTIK
jgi:FlaA1/EpsC-like NDP-sugar epimerase